MRFFYQCFFFLCAIWLCAVNVFAQTGDVRGYVYDTASGEPIIFTNVFIEGTTYGSSTDVNGFYSITKIPVGKYTLVSTYIGYDTIRTEIEIIANRIASQNIFLSEQSVSLETIEISAQKEESRTEIKASVIKISPKQITKIPSIGGEPDLAQYLQILPGVTFTGDQGGQLYIRGGSPIQTKVLLDGLTVYNPFHSIGLFSVFDTEIIKNVEVFTGGFNAYYGGRVSAVIDVTTIDGNKKRHEGKVSVGPFLASATLNGPLVKMRDNGSSLSYVLSYKNSYLDRTSPVFYEYINDEGKLPYTFNDFYGKIAFNTKTGSKLNFFGFNFNDAVHFSNDANYDWKSTGAGGNFVLVPYQSKLIMNGKFSYSKYDISLLEADAIKPRTSSIGGFTFGLDFKYFLPKGSINYGFDASGFRTDFAFTNSTGLKIEQNQNTSEIGGFAVYKQQFNKLVIEPSIRFNYYASLSTGSLEPRLGVKYNVNDRFRLKFAGGRYSQNFISTKSDRDVVNLFTGFLSLPEYSLTDREGNKYSSNLETAWHAIAGFEYDISNNFDVNIEGYYKDFTQLVNLNREKLFANDPDFIVETGDAYGVDFLFKYELNRLYLWTAYSLSFVTRTDGELTYYPHFDRRHNLNFVGSYQLGKRKDWELSARWNLGSGFPFTRTEGFYEEINFSDGISTDYVSQNGDLGLIYEDKLNAGRLPYYHRLDVSLKKEFRFGEHSTLEATASVTNLYNRDNIFYINRITLEKIYQLPLLPSVSIAWKF
ncbi:MAG: TonB-dependent receptor [Chitinophagales bacterium]|nr:TonB-dependent receptor [Bacteroidota bacterium]MCB9044296.1 TonB-dependent receptor [Chitinophagales bacterium]